ncbi:bifunctional [glutamine synthetase] adenylyltransferase/[glutamine synthetase]-adenylyl-L-tyrosine phosphorylase [Acidocella aminolytica]|jgi:glutamate-ammonia-ligase adenylyltransferase|uniref:Glutamate-ammonia-ligase adenylyltransferase n=1 Tax=Acidocella aminolytica 101 = DSM 11237 TaxID=1120923 RepID=A0A0D6PG22_9PROT|nr:bifunctional [glutamine synthetase] adenylyltransferase/[glutamine synthetase]-adenylyl-L-tyrosine phosphorylase [Acidocella aminolytica]GAN80705.1 glutamate-ammonia-ligase adenylyltransferase [Acidocella aminolytica 101 = DSM 11237]GBQ37542.1 glutamine synthetase adenylyltransferase [Acidocella aminolytica 101 = DSM 11237]SHE53525.1 glutamate-ammonia-ligase adenylyltransferase [Acidocella aminolytica 101 = DSM 11237]
MLADLHKPSFPQAADQAAASHLRTDFAALGAQEAAFAATESGASLLDALGGNAPYLSDLACREPATLLACMENGPHPEALLAALAALPPDTPRAQLSAALRRTKRQIALTIAVADLGGLWPLEKVTTALSDLAETALRASVRHLLWEMHEDGEITLPHPDAPERDSGFVALALGKLGARELNYSSDIDLVLLYDPEAAPYEPDSQRLMVRLARDLTTLLSARDADGYVFRVDLRLRPDPGATPPVVALPTALTYYESHGRTWERAAFSKARPVAGDIVLGQHFLSAIRPFIWRKYLDFAAISDIHEMKRQIDAQSSNKGLSGFDVKLGRGGIREIEFVVQTLGLVWGGHDPALRIPATLEALLAMARAGHIPERAAKQLAADYRELRRVEHRLQMVADRQTHELPNTEAALDAFCVFLNTPRFKRDFPHLLARVHAYFLDFFNADTEDTKGALDPGVEGPPPAEFTARLRELGFKDDKHIATRLREWSSGSMQALRSHRARELLDGLVPHLLAALAAQPEPDKVFAQFDTLLSRQRAGVQLLSLFTRNTALLKRLAAVLGAAPALSDYLADDPQALDGLLAPQARFAAPRPLLRRLLADAEDLEQAVATTRRLVRQEEFHLSVATLEGRLDANEGGRLRSALAEASLSLLLPFVIAAQKERQGPVRGAKVAVVALGKAGAGEMLAGSDLDLMLIYDHAPTAIAPTQWFVRLSHSFVGALTAQGPGGPLYHVDMRLRPSGNAGPVAVSLAAFRNYHARESWTWERLALTRARVIAATPGFAATVREAILGALCRPEPPERIFKDTAAMQARLAAELPPSGPFDLRGIPGGMMEVGFVAQALQLIHGATAPALFQPNTAKALKTLADAGHLRQSEAETLIQADFLWRTIQGINRITGLSARANEPPTAMLDPLLRATGFKTLSAMRTEIIETARAAHEIFARLIIEGTA